jgi:ribonuclease G
MAKEILINSSAFQNRVAITEDGVLVDYFVDHIEKRRMVGNIYLGRVARILPGIRAVFIDIGMKHDAFLHFADIDKGNEQANSLFEEDEGDEEETNERREKFNFIYEKPRLERRKGMEYPTLRKGQKVIIQIIKEPVKGKGVRVTSSPSLPGRFCVLIPFESRVGVSKKITDFRERKRLRRIARKFLPENFGLIIRTAAKGQDEESIKTDIKYLTNVWREVEKQAKQKTPPALLYRDLSTTTSVIRDLFTPDVTKIYVDSRKLYREIRDYVRSVQPEQANKVVYHKSSTTIFEDFQIEDQVQTLFSRRVQLQSGGYIIIEHTEAMTVIDVNSGKYAKKREQEANSLKTDLEASREIVRQLRLRDIGGLIVVDFIDLEDEINRKKVYDELKKEFKKDRAKVVVLPMTEFGLVQITRERVRENILQSTHEVCPYCQGTGILQKKSSTIHDIEDWIKRHKKEGKLRFLRLKVHPSIFHKLKEGGLKSLIVKWQFKYALRIKLEVDESVNPRDFIFLSSKGEDLTDLYQ